jgi:hypothetical protein
MAAASPHAGPPPESNRETCCRVVTQLAPRVPMPRSGLPNAKKLRDVLRADATGRCGGIGAAHASQSEELSGFLANCGPTPPTKREVANVPDYMPRNLREAIRDGDPRPNVQFLWQKAEPFHARQCRARSIRFGPEALLARGAQYLPHPLRCV